MTSPFTLEPGAQRRFGKDVPVTVVRLRGLQVATIRPCGAGLRWATDGAHTPNEAGDAITQGEALERIADVLRRAQGPTMPPLEVRRAEAARQADLFKGARR